MSTLLKTNFILLCLIFIFVDGFGNCSDFVPGQVLVKLKQSNTSQKTSLQTQLKAATLKRFDHLDLELWELTGSQKKDDVNAIIEKYKDHPDIEYIEPNYIFSLPEMIEEVDAIQSALKIHKTSDTNPNDPRFLEQWNLHNTNQLGDNSNIDIRAREAWNTVTESPYVKVAILDTGIDYGHEDLVKNIWQNSGEDTDGDGVLVFQNGYWVFDPDDENGIDDDGNGYIDDFVGWDFGDNDNNPFDSKVNGHGTQVAGIIGASGNNDIGIAGISWNVQMVALKIFNDSGASCTDIIEALNYAVSMSFPISNNSYNQTNCESESISLYDAIQNAQNNEHIFVAAAGNNGSDNDEFENYPSCYDLDNIISVSAMTNFGGLTGNITSNYGESTVDIVAPGNKIMTTAPNNSYHYFAQTSAATPHVTAACALIKHLNPNYSVSQIKMAIIDNAEITPDLSGTCVSGGYLDLHAALNANLDQNPACRAKDYLGLSALHSATKGANWFNKWNLEDPITSWYGVDFNTNGCVVGINLSANNLNGHLPDEIGLIKELQILNLKNNDISGEVNPALENLTNLKVLNLEINALSGNIPLSLYNINSLEEINLSNNQLTGNISSAIGNLIALKIIKLKNNQLTGIIPGELASLISLKRLILSNNKFGGSIPYELANLNSLIELELQANELSGCYDSDFSTSTLCNFSSANISNGNSFTNSWNNFCNTGIGTCGSCSVTDKNALIALYNATNGASWTNSWNINQNMNTWHGVSLNNKGCVIELDLRARNLVGTIPTEIGNLQSLQRLYIWANSNTTGDLTGNIPTSIGNLNNLTELWLSSNNLTGAIPGNIGNLKNLTTLLLNSNELSGSIPSSIGSITNLKVLNLSKNNLENSIPSTFINFKNLQEMTLADNELSGNIPLQIGNLTQLKTLNLRNNMIGGSIPASLGNCNKLNNLALNHNQLENTIPPELAYCSNLWELALDFNNLSGQIPYEFENLTNIVYLNLSNNDLIGEIPPNFSNLRYMTRLVVSHNLLSGCYGKDLKILCDQLTPNIFNLNEDTSDGNTFNTTWTDFCNTDNGTCDLVWPGDSNDDGIVDEVDVLFWGLAYGNSGPQRTDATTNWTGQDAPLWHSNVEGVNGRHQDCDGNGIVYDNDLNSIDNNFGKTRGSESTVEIASTNYITYEKNVSNDKLIYDFSLKDDQGNDTETHGIAFSIEFKDSISTIEYDVTESCLKPQETEVFEVLDEDHKKYHFAITRKDGNNQFCNAPFARIIVAIDNVPTNDSLQMRINGISMQQNGDLQRIGNTTIYSDRPGTNPAGSLEITALITHQQCGELGTAEVTIEEGVAPFTYAWSTLETINNSYEWFSKIDNLTPGFYGVKVTDALGGSDNLTFEIQGQLIPEFDENGNFMDCNSICPSVLNLNNSYPNGNNQALKAVIFNGVADNNNNLQLKVGATGRIRLENNFFATKNSNFSAAIEDCPD